MPPVDPALPEDPTDEFPAVRPVGASAGRRRSGAAARATGVDGDRSRPVATRATPRATARPAADPVPGADTGGRRAIADSGSRRAGVDTGGRRAVTDSGGRRAVPTEPPEGGTGGAPRSPGGRARRRAAAPPTSVGHGHGHGHGAAPPAGRRVRVLIAALLVPCALATLVGLVLLWPGPVPTPEGAQIPVRAEVTAAETADCTPGSGDRGCAALVLRMDDGPLPGRELVQLVPVEPSTPTFGVGDDVVVAWSGGDPNDPSSYQVVDFQRSGALLWLAALFAGAVLLLGRLRGLAALGALVLSFAVLLGFVLPAILSGHDPLAVAVTGSCLIMFAVLYLTHGPSARTSVAVLGTLVSLALIGLLGAGFSAAARLTGIDDESANLIATLGTGVDARGLLLAGVVIGALGVLDDVTVTQTSAVWELRRADPSTGVPGLFTAAMRIGRDHVASAVNTLVLAYAGASLPLLLLFSLSGQGLGDVATTQAVGTEIVRTLVGSIGLVASVPITTALAAVVASRETEEALRP